MAKNSEKMALGPKNIRLMIAGLLVLAAGFLLLSGGGSPDPNEFNYAMFDFRRLVAAPVVMVAGIVVEVIAIMGRFDAVESKDNKSLPRGEGFREGDTLKNK